MYASFNYDGEVSLRFIPLRRQQKILLAEKSVCSSLQPLIDA